MVYLYMNANQTPSYLIYLLIYATLIMFFKTTVIKLKTNINYREKVIQITQQIV